MNTRSTQTPQVRVVNAQEIKQVRRTPRNPAHSWNVKAKAHEICPVMIAPVLPGETLQNLIMQSTVVSDPLKNPLIGWWQEYYFFYVPLPGLQAWDTGGLLQSMMLDSTTDLSTLKASANSTAYYTYNGGMDFLQAATEAVVKEYFRDEGEEASAASIENYFAAQIDQGNWLHSMKLESAGADDDELPGVDDQEEVDILPTFTAEYAQWEMMRDQGMTDLTYEDFLRSYGVDVPKAEETDPENKYRPEVIRYFRKYSAPSNTIDPSTGSPSSAAYWKVAERADKKRFFKYPGFLVGFSVTRPKIYLGSQMGSAVGMLENAYSWLPAVLNGYPYTSVIEQLDSLTTGILQNQTEDYWLDIKDLFIHGDQFVNHSPEHALALPTATGEKKYPTETMLDALFVTAGSEYIRQDGIASLNILSRVGPDTTP